MNDDLLRKTLRYRWLIFWILAFSYVLVYFHRLCPAVVALDMMRDLKAGAFRLAGYKQAFLILFLCAVVTFAASLCLRETMEKERKE